MEISSASVFHSYCASTCHVPPSSANLPAHSAPASTGPCSADEELQEMIDEADRDGDGEVNEEEFFR